MQAPVATRMTITTPGGLRTMMERSRQRRADQPGRRAEPALADRDRDGQRPHAHDPLRRGRQAASPTSSPTGPHADHRGRRAVAAAAGRGARRHAVGLHLRRAGRLTRVGAGHALRRPTPTTRAAAVGSITDSLSRATEFTYDVADRLTTIRAPGRASGRLRLRRQRQPRCRSRRPGRPRTRSRTPAAAFAADRTRRRLLGGTEHADDVHDRQGRPDHGVDRPGGRSIGFTYDAAGRLATVTQPRGTTRLDYDAATGQLTSRDRAGR